MKTKLIFLLMLVMAVVSSCMDEVAINGGSEPVPEGKAALKLIFKGLGASSPRSYATLTATELEAQLDSVRIFVFDDTDLLENVYTVQPVRGTSSSEYEATVLLSEEGQKYIVAIGNPDVEKVPGLMETPVGMTYDEFKELTTMPSDRMPLASFVMCGEKSITVTVDNSVSVQLDMSRLVARIDIVNNDSLGANKNRFIMEKARLIKAASGGFLIPRPAASADVRLLENLPWVENKDNAATGTKNGQMRSQLYTYENSTEGETFLEVAGTYNGKPAQYQVPFNGKSIKANNLYVVMIDSVTTTEIIADIMVREWVGDTIEYTPTTSDAPVVTCVPGGLKALISDTRAVTPGTGEYVTDTIWLKSNALDTTRFVVESENVQAVFHSDSTWATVKEKIESYANIRQEFVIEFAKNETKVDRTTLIEFRNAAQPSKFVRYCIKQSAVPQLDLVKWATSNLDDIGLFVGGANGKVLNETTSDADFAGAVTNFGGLFQWGRNVRFTNYNGDGTNGGGSTENMVAAAEKSIQGPMAATDARVKGTNFIKNATSPYNWMTGGRLDDTWNSVARQVGMEGKSGDPCPAGWRLPTVEEIAEIMPINSTAGAYATSNTSGNFAAETTTGYYYEEGNTTDKKFVTSTAPAYYYGGGTSSGNNGVVYGVKKQGTEYAAAFRWEHVGTTNSSTGGSYLKITSVKVAKEFVPTGLASVRDLDWDGSEAVVRYFPAADHRQYTGFPFRRTEGLGLYWSSSASSESGAWCLGFNGSHAYLSDSYRAFGFSVRCVAR